MNAAAPNPAQPEVQKVCSLTEDHDLEDAFLPVDVKPVKPVKPSNQSSSPDFRAVQTSALGFLLRCKMKEMPERKEVRRREWSAGLGSVTRTKTPGPEAGSSAPPGRFTVYGCCLIIKSSHQATLTPTTPTEVGGGSYLISTLHTGPGLHCLMDSRKICHSATNRQRPFPGWQDVTPSGKYQQ